MADKLLSRKFWLALAACVYFAFNHAFGEIAQVVVAYLAVQAAVDGFIGYQEAKQAAEPPAD